MLQESPPAGIADMLNAPELVGRVVLLSASTDVDAEGRVARQWLFATDKEVLVYVDGDSPHLLRRIELAQITHFRTRSVIGSGFLQAMRNGVWLDLLRYSNRLSSQFRRAANKLDRLCKQHEFEVVSSEEEKSRTCPDCGVALRFPGDVCPRCVPHKRTLKRVLGLIRPHRGMAILMCLLSIVAVTIELVPPLLQEVLVDKVLKVDAPQSQRQVLMQLLLLLVAGLAAVRLAAALVAVLKGWISSKVGTSLTADLRTQMVEKLQALPVSYHDTHQVGMLMSRISYDTEVMHTLLHQLTSGFLLQLLQLVGIGGMLFHLNPKLAFFTLLPMPLVVVGSCFFSRYLYPLNQRYWDAVGKQASALTGMLSGIRVVKAFTQESREYQRFQASSDRLRESRLRVDNSTVTFSSLMGFTFGLGALIVWYVGGHDVLIHEMSLGSLMAFLAYLAMFYTPLTTLSESTTWLSTFTAASHRIFEMLDTPLQIQEPAAPQSLSTLRGRIEFQNVNFGYEENQPVLKDVSFTIQPGEIVGIVGRSGSGKSTLINLISRMYDVTSGSVLIDGVNVCALSSQELRRKIGMVLQEPFLFEGTIESNIVYGRPEACPEQILHAAKAANAHEFIMRMPFAYHTTIGERGTGLSGGERQRLSIARAFLYEPKILILDEATSSIDTESERAIQEALRRFSRGRTTISVAHRLCTLKDANRLLVFDQGRLIEHGTHAQLVAKNGVYASLVRIQSSFQSAAQELQAVAHRSVGAQDGFSPAEAFDGNGFNDGSGDGAQQYGGHEEAIGCESCAEAGHQLHWLTAENAEFYLDPESELLNVATRAESYRGVYVIRAFPTTHPDEYLSVLNYDGNGSTVEIGIVRRLCEWPGEIQQLLRQSLSRQYLVRIVSSLDELRPQQGFLYCVVQTDVGSMSFLMPMNRDGIKPYGPNGRMLIDVDDNYYLIPDINQLPARQQRNFQRHFAI